MRSSDLETPNEKNWPHAKGSILQGQIINDELEAHAD